MNDIKLYENVPLIDNSFTVKFRKYENIRELIPHWHEHIELLYILAGDMELLVGGEAIIATAGDLVVVNPNQIHTFTSLGVSYYCILIYPEFFADIAPISQRIEALIKGDRRLSLLFDRMSREAEEGRVGADMIIKACAYEIIACLLREYGREPLSDEQLRREGVMRERISEVCKYISLNYMKDISTRELAALCYLTESHFCRFFKRMVGKSAMQYINSFRIERAGVLLRESNLSVFEVAEEVGISNLNYFSRIFKKIKGKTPLEYRKDHKNEHT